MTRVSYTGSSEGWRRFLAAGPDPAWELIHDPLLEFIESEDHAELDDALANPTAWDGIVVTSPRAARIVARRILSSPGGSSSSRKPGWWAIGPATAAPLEPIGIEPRQPPPTARHGEGLATEILAAGLGRILYPGARSRSGPLSALLRAEGREVRQLEVYRVELGSDTDARRVVDAGAVVIATSARVAGMLGRHRGAAPSGTRLVAIGSTTAAAAAEAGWTPAAVATGPDGPGLVEAVGRAFWGR